MSDASHAAHAHEHPPHLAHHFDTPAQQFESSKLGMWIFLATEILMFGGLFCAYAVYRANNPDVFMYAHQSLNTFWGTVNTVILLASSFTMAWAVRAAQLGQKQLLVTLLALTLAGGVGFLIVKSIEYTEKWHKAQWVGPWNEYHPNFPAQDSPTTADFGPAAPPQNGVLPEDHPAVEDAELQASPPVIDPSPAPSDIASEGVPTGPTDAPQPTNVTMLPPAQPALPADSVSLIQPAQQGPIGVRTEVIDGNDVPMQVRHGYPTLEEMSPLDRDRTHIFYQIYYMMTGLHVIHVLIGMGLITWVFRRATAGHFSPAYYTPVDIVGLYWHLVDLIWIFLFPLLYLIH